MAINQEIRDEAAQWHAAMAGDDPDFDGFTAWLEASPDHARAYDAMIMLDDIVEANKAAIHATMPANDIAGVEEHHANERPFRRRFLATAAALAVTIPGLLWFGMAGSSVTLSTSTVPMQVALDARTQIELDRNSLLRHDKGQTDKVELAQGAAHFNVAHDPARSFTVKVGSVSVIDLGTQFEIQRNGDQVGVAVAEGSVAVALGENRKIILRAGQRAFVEGGEIRTGPIDTGSVSTWRKGQLVYRDAPLSQVVKEISRYTPVPVTVDPSLADRQFSGVLTIGDGRSLDRNLADFMGLARSQQDKSVRIGARP